MPDTFGSQYNNDLPSLAIGERIVWISDNGPEYGNVKWLGKLPDLGPEWMAGVEFDNPVGSGTGLYENRQLFVTPLNHASLVPIIGLMKASDFHEPPKPPARSTSVKLIDFNSRLAQEYIDRRHLFDDFDDFSISRENCHGQDEHHRGPINNINTNNNNQSSNNPLRVRHIPIRIEGQEKKQQQLKHRSGAHISSSSSSSKIPDGELIAQVATRPRQPPVVASDRQDVQRNLGRLNRPVPSITSKTTTTNPATRYSQPLAPLLPPPPYCVEQVNERSSSYLLGKDKGIQGHNNSCYLDATLFSMFSSTTLFDSLLYRPAKATDIPEYGEIQRILRDNIVIPLRKQYFVSADKVMQFRTMLEQSSTVDGLTDQEKDPEEFLSLLLGQLLKAEPYLKLSSGLESFLYQLIVEKDENVVLPTVQDLCEQSFISSTVRLREIPPCLFLQMPRFGREYKMYSRILPSKRLDITDILEASPRACGYRGKDCDNLARFECRDCFLEHSSRQKARLSTITYCEPCFQAKHFGKSHATGIESHDKTKTVLDKIPDEAIQRYSNRHQSSRGTSSSSSAKDKEIPRIYMDLFAVLCIETSHYVCFVKCGQDFDSPWCFFDSMADRRGEQNGYNIPEVLLFDEFNYWTSDKGASQLMNNRDDKQLPELTKRLVCDAYLCFYQYNGLKSYR